MKKQGLDETYKSFLLGTVAKPDSSLVDDLSQRELQVLIAIGLGLRPADTAARLHMAVKSYGTYRERVLEKLHVKSNAELAILAFELKLVPSVLERLKENEDERNRITANPAATDSG